MSFGAFCNRHATIQQLSGSVDGAGGSTDTWAAVGVWQMRATTPSSRQSLEYSRAGFTNVVRLQGVNRLRKRIHGKTTLSEAVLEIGVQQFRILYHGRTLSIIGVRCPNDQQIHGQGGLVNLDCIETPQPTGYLDA